MCTCKIHLLTILGDNRTKKKIQHCHKARHSKRRYIIVYGLFLHRKDDKFNVLLSFLTDYRALQT